MYHRLTQPRLNGLLDNLVGAEVCLYTVTPDEHFVIDFHPKSERVVIASPCSGHGFKHSAAIGETLAQLALDGESEFDISAFRLARLSEPPLNLPGGQCLAADPYNNKQRRLFRHARQTGINIRQMIWTITIT